MLLYGDFLVLQEFRDSVEHMKKKLSVIIPVYNQLEYFKKCLDSVVNQTYSNLEIICVDDGSTDGAQDYLDEVASKDSRVIAIHQKNSGESHARNVGLMQATGDYITFVDCDDWIEEDMYDSMMRVAEEEDLDLVACSWYKVKDEKPVKVENELNVSSNLIDNEELLDYVYKRDLYRNFAYIWNKIYKREILEDEGTLRRFDEDIYLGADVTYLARAILKANRAKYMDRPFYHYTFRVGSGSHSNDISKARDLTESYKETVELLKNAKVKEETVNYAIRILVYHAIEGIEIAIEKEDSTAKKYFRELMLSYESVYLELNKNYPDRVELYKRLINN